MFTFFFLPGNMNLIIKNQKFYEMGKTGLGMRYLFSILDVYFQTGRSCQQKPLII